MTYIITRSMTTAAALGLSFLFSGCGSAMTRAVNAGDPNAVEAAIASGADPNRYFGIECEFGGCIGGQTPLMWATVSGELEVMELLIKRGAKVDAPEKTKN